MTNIATGGTRSGTVERVRFAFVVLQCVLVVGLFGRATTAAHAQAPDTLRLRYTAPASCPNESAFLALLAEQLGAYADRSNFEQAGLTVAVLVVEDAGVFHTRLQYRLADADDSERGFHDSDCAASIRAASLAVALLLDPSVLLRAPEDISPAHALPTAPTPTASPLEFPVEVRSNTSHPLRIRNVDVPRSGDATEFECQPRCLLPLGLYVAVLSPPRARDDPRALLVSNSFPITSAAALRIDHADRDERRELGGWILGVSIPVALLMPVLLVVGFALGNVELGALLGVIAGAVGLTGVGVGASFMGQRSRLTATALPIAQGVEVL